MEAQMVSRLVTRKAAQIIPDGWLEHDSVEPAGYT
jgi:hypothetical protein